MDTIIALSSGALPAAVAVIRISGPSTSLLVEMFCGRMPAPRQASYRALRDKSGLIIDRGLVLWFRGPMSFTGEDSAEFQVHGGRAVVDRILDLATGLPGVRPAEPGEFARRAFINGKLDLTGAEALADLIEAETEVQRRFAVDQALGQHERLYDGWRDRLLHARAMIEAEIDFADEEDVPGSVAEQVWSDVQALADDIEAHIDEERRGRIMRGGFEIALIGRPNVGKSTLLNRLAGSERAIVSSEPGTTRDVVEARLDLGGYLVLVADTAGLRESDAAVEVEGMRRARERAKESDLVLHLDDADRFGDLPDLSDMLVWRIATKGDLKQAASKLVSNQADFAISAKTGEGVEALVKAIGSEVELRTSNAVGLAPGQARHVACLTSALNAIADSLRQEFPLEVRAEHLRLAALELGRITGRIDVEDMLGVIFSRFCIGK